MNGDGGEDEGGAGGRARDLLGGSAEDDRDVPVHVEHWHRRVLLHHLCCSLQLTLLSSILV
jgi:hypothetical protein